MWLITWAWTDPETKFILSKTHRLRCKYISEAFEWVTGNVTDDFFDLRFQEEYDEG